MKKTRMGFALGVACSLTALLPVSSIAQESGAKAAGAGASNSVTSNIAVRSGRSGSLNELLIIRDENEQAGILADVKDGTVNDHQVPGFLKLSPTDPSDVRPGNDTVQDRSAVAPIRAPSALISVPGYSNDDNAAIIGGRITPPDTNGDVGLTHYVQYINLGWVVLNKSNGSVAAGPFAGNTFWQGFGGVCETQNAGDPVVLYDQLAGRWLFSQFTGTSVSDGHQCVALSDGENPLGPYTLYDFVVSPGAFNDYPKIGVWPDGYYMTTHEFVGQNFQGVNLTVFDRTQMLAGNLNAGFVQFSNVTSGDTLDFGTIAGNLEGPNVPPAGTCNYLVHATDVQAFGLTGSDRYRFWEACINFSNPNNSTLAQTTSVNVPAFDVNLCGFSRDCIFQPNPQRLDPLAGFTIYRFNMRYFGSEGVLKGVATNNVDVGGDRAGVQWAGFDINPSNNAINIGDAGDLLGVIDFGDSLSRWMGSATLDQDGNIGIGYTRSSSASFPSVYYTVHERGVDGAGAVQQEAVCVNGTGATTGANRWADYASASMDPVDQCTFWITNEYVETTGNFNWNTRVCAFQIPSCGSGGPVNQPPTASFTFNCNDLACSFDGSGSSDSDGSIVSYSWAFGDSSTGSGVTTNHTYANAGTFNVSLTVTDDDGATGNQVQPVTVTAPPTGGNCPAGSIDFNNFTTTAFATQDGAGSINILDGGDTFQLIGNRWRASTQNYAITANTVVEFEFASDSQGEIHGIGMDEDNTLTQNRIFRVFGTQNYGNAINPQYSGGGAFQSYSIPVGQSFTGGSFRLIFVNDKDAGTQNNESRFRCVRVFEDTPGGGQCSVDIDFESGADGWTNGTSTCTTGAYVLGTPSQQSSGGIITQVGGDNTTGSGSAIFSATNTSAGNADIDGGNCVLLSPVWTVTEASTLEASYFHGQRDAGDDPGDDFFELEVSTNGGASFTSFVSIGDVRTAAAWTPASTSIPAGTQVQLRMQASDGAGPGDIVEAGIDDVSICANN